MCMKKYLFLSFYTLHPSLLPQSSWVSLIFLWHRLGAHLWAGAFAGWRQGSVGWDHRRAEQAGQPLQRQLWKISVSPSQQFPLTTHCELSFPCSANPCLAAGFFPGLDPAHCSDAGTGAVMEVSILLALMIINVVSPMASHHPEQCPTTHPLGGHPHPSSATCRVGRGCINPLPTSRCANDCRQREVLRSKHPDLWMNETRNRDVGEGWGWSRWVQVLDHQWCLLCGGDLDLEQWWPRDLVLEKQSRCFLLLLPGYSGDGKLDCEWKQLYDPE